MYILLVLWQHVLNGEILHHPRACARECPDDGAKGAVVTGQKGAVAGAGVADKVDHLEESLSLLNLQRFLSNKIQP